MEAFVDALAVQVRHMPQQVTIVEVTEVIFEAIEATVDCIDRMAAFVIFRLRYLYSR